MKYHEEISSQLSEIFDNVDIDSFKTEADTIYVEFSHRPLFTSKTYLKKCEFKIIKSGVLFKREKLQLTNMS